MKKVLKYIKNFIIVTITMLAFIIAVGDPDDFTNKILILKLACVGWIWLVAYANNMIKWIERAKKNEKLID